ncbi:MAG: hypothetical protein AAGA60_28725 [Cyanobacteria bacterium P01_E01_bin.42]
MNQSQSKRDRISRSRRVILVGLLALLWLCSSQTAFAHAGHSHQRSTPTPSPSPQISPTEIDEGIKGEGDREDILPTSTSDSLTENPQVLAPKTEPIPLLGEGLLAGIFIAPMVLTWLKRNYHQSRSKK